MAHHRLTLKHVGPGWQPSCSCGWVGLPRTRSTAQAEYHRHRAHVERRHAEGDVVAPRELTPFDDLPEALRAPHPDLAPFDAAIAATVARIKAS